MVAYFSLMAYSNLMGSTAKRVRNRYLVEFRVDRTVNIFVFIDVTINRLLTVDTRDLMVTLPMIDCMKFDDSAALK